MSEKNQPVKPISGPNIKPLRREGDFSALSFGKVMPQAVSLEEAILGAIMLDRDAMTVVMDILSSDSFYLIQHQKIYSTMLELFGKSIPIDLLTVKEELKKRNELDAIGGPAYLAELTYKIGSAANLEFHARIVAQKYIQRELIRICTTTIKDSFEDTKDVFDILDEAERNLFEVTQQNMNRGFESIRALTTQARVLIDELAKKTDGLTGVPSGFTALDRITSGWQKSDMIIIAARPGMGKTSFALSLARNAALNYGKGVAIFSLEMSNVQLSMRLLSMEARIEGAKLRNGQLEEHDWKPLHDAMDRLAEAPIFIDDTPAINIFELRAKCRRLKMQHDIQLIMIDYLQLMSGGPENKKGNREQEISSISRSLKGLAKELNVPVIALSQLSRAVETRGGNKRPVLSDLRESGAIEQDADIVTFIYRPEYYELGEEADVGGANSEIILSKHRNGQLGSVNLQFIKDFALFEDADDFDFRKGLGTQFQAPESDFITRSSRLNEEEDEIPF
jgi:replicative DNA helicase